MVRVTVRFLEPSLRDSPDGDGSGRVVWYGAVVGVVMARLDVGHGPHRNG